ncbi:TonB-dependent receptor [Pleionea sp. CnH1-48]|uniref:TonB-dependent receptor n=1 Tax=Pleionea sp. CnH1-48 TaxID=2954494 RepID=UPI00209840DD|nr:TonB-dependent receptor [Pleionea sp. CnH1-48]MCO7224798.1 TonB-dependent receptor [Pleionea sp. CnH1-48]
MRSTPNRIRNAVKLAIICGMGSGLVTPMAYAEDDSEEGEKLVITGSSIKRTDFEGALPVQTIDREAIDRSGVSSVAELVQLLPVMQGFAHAADSVGGDGKGVSAASIHDLGDTYTLVLLNGRRLAPSGDGNRIDLNSLPLAAIERIEILTDGSSAIYGSDAIAGVVNFILKDDYQESMASVRYSSPQQEGGGSWSANFTTGFGDIDGDGYNVILSFSHDSQEQLKGVDREWAKTGIISFEHQGRDLYFFNGSGNSIPGNARVRWTNPNTGEVEEQIFNPYLSQSGSCPQQTSQIGQECWFDYTSTIEIFPENERNNFLAQGQFKINDDITAFAEAMYSDFTLTARIAPFPTGWVRLPNSAGIVTDEVLPQLTQEQRDNLVSVDGRWRALPAGNRTTEWNTKSTHLVAGVKGVVGDEVDFEASLIHSVNDTEQNYTDGWLLATPFINALGAGSINIFAPQGTVTGAEFDGLMYVGNWDVEKTTLDMIKFNASKPIFEMDGGAAYFGGGFDYRATQYDRTVSTANRTEAVLFTSADPEFDLDRDAYGVFGEIILPFSSDFEMTAALRYDRIGAVKGNNGSVNEAEGDTTYKISASWDATDELLFRASIGTGFKAPDLQQIARPRSDDGVTSGNFACPFPQGDPLEQFCLTGNSQYAVFLEGNPDLKPERSEQKTVGMVYAPSKDTTIRLDYWSVEMEDQVNTLTEAQIFNDPVTYRDLFTTRLNNATGEQELAIVQANVNIGQVKNTGLDWEFAFAHDFSFGRLSTQLAGTYIIDSQYTLPGTDDVWVTSLGRFGSNNQVTFRNIAKLSSTLSHDRFNHTLSLHYRSGYADQFQSKEACSVTLVDATGDCVEVQLRVSAYTKLDYLTQYEVNDDLRLSFGINNLLDREPDLSLRSGGAGHQVGYDPRYVDVFGRTFYVSADYRF